jgi:hypothetical protein
MRLLSSWLSRLPSREFLRGHEKRVNIVGTGNHREVNSNCGLEVFRKLFEDFKHNVATDSKRLDMWLFQLRPRLQLNHWAPNTGTYL